MCHSKRYLAFGVIQFCKALFAFLWLIEEKKNSQTTTARNIWDTPNENVLLFWPWIKSEMMTMMCWYDTFLSPYWIFMLHWNSDLQRASVGSHVSLSLAQHSVNTLWGIAMATGCYGWYDTTTHSSGRGQRELHNKSQECKQGMQAIILISEWTEGLRAKVEKTSGFRES